MAADLPVIESTTHRHAIRFADADQWWAWCWSHGGRAALEQLDDDQRRDVRRAGAAMLADRPLPGGGLGYHCTLRFTIARRETV